MWLWKALGEELWGQRGCDGGSRSSEDGMVVILVVVVVETAGWQ